MHSSRFFRVKPIGRLFYEVQKKSGNHTISNQSLLLGTTVLNDIYHEIFHDILYHANYLKLHSFDKLASYIRDIAKNHM